MLAVFNKEPETKYMGKRECIHIFFNFTAFLGFFPYLEAITEASEISLLYVRIASFQKLESSYRGNRRDSRYYTTV
jgi:hypothetical protein